jgi:lipocalin
VTTVTYLLTTNNLKMKYFIVLIAVAIAGAFEIFERPCRTRDELQVKSGFTPLVFVGQWFEHERYESANQTGLDCVTAQYTGNFNPDLTLRDVTVVNRGRNIATGQNFEDQAIAVISFPDEVPLRAQLNVTFAPGREYLRSLFVKKM